MNLLRVLLLGLLLAACSNPTTGDSNTNWLGECANDSECGEGDCLCGICSEICEPGSCGEAVCISADDVSLKCRAEVDAVCLPDCSEVSCALGLYCVTGACVPKPIDCLCPTCAGVFASCDAAIGCRQIAACADETGCVGMECYDSGLCREVIGRYGVASDGFNRYLGTSMCACGDAPIVPSIDACR